MLQNSNIKMAENKDEIQTDTEDVAQFFFFSSSPKKSSLCFTASGMVPGIVLLHLLSHVE